MFFQDYNWSKTCRTASLFGTFSFVVGFPSGILDNESRKRLEPLRGSVRFTPPFNTRFCEAKPVLQYYTRQVMLFLAICVVYAIILTIILLLIIIVYERIIFKYFGMKSGVVDVAFLTDDVANAESSVTQSNHITNTHNRLNIRARPPSRWSGPTYRRKTSSAIRRAKSVVKRGFICGINGIYLDDEPSSSEFSDLTNSSNGNFGI